MGDLVQILIATATTGSTIALIALGINIVFATTRVVNFAQGGIVVAAGYIAFVFSSPAHVGMNVWLAFGLTTLAGILLGIFVDLWGVSALGGYDRNENRSWLIITLSVAALALFWLLIPSSTFTKILAMVAVAGIIVGVAYGIARPSPLGKFDPATNVGWIITTFALGMFFIPNIVTRAISNSPEKIPELVGGKAITIAGQAITPSDLLIVGMSIALLVAIELVMSRTMLGRAFHAVSQDPTTASLMGINTGSIVIIAFGLAGALGAIASVLIAPKLFVKLDNSITLSIWALVAVVLGGLGSTKGAVVGAYLVALITAAVTTLAPDGDKWAQPVLFLGLLVILRVRPTGLFGRVAVEKV
ncbi:MAG: branched-chain amino acid ABC transporter permease [Acidimicrobiia bacterium]|nr:branched-chain amino acid ABC transporter permease [Acidimicrobiia bacterium]